MKMDVGAPVDPRLPWVRVVHDTDEAWSLRGGGGRVRALRRVGERLHDVMREGETVVSVRTLPLSSLLYPTKHAFDSAVPLPVPFVHMVHRSLLVQVRAGGELKNILFNPTDVEAAKATPFFRKLIERFGESATRMLQGAYSTLDAQLAALGVRNEDIDVLAFDHFHTQDVRALLGTDVPVAGRGKLAARFPNAVLLAPRQEWNDWGDLHPMQRTWFVPGGNEGVPEERVILTDNDLWLGEGCLLLRTPGHTIGNQTIFVHGDDGVFGCSENGTSADNWSPYESRIPGVARHARLYELEVLLNANTPELGGHQYASMVLERSLVDRVPDAPAFVQMFPSSEVTPHLLTPGIRPSMLFGNRDSGTVQTTVRQPRASSHEHATR